MGRAVNFDDRKLKQEAAARGISQAAALTQAISAGLNRMQAERDPRKSPALASFGALRKAAKKTPAAKMSMGDINKMIREVRTRHLAQGIT